MQSQLLRGLRHERRCHVVTLPDGHDRRKCPYDFGVCCEGHYHAVECKRVAGSQASMSFKQLRAHQGYFLSQCDTYGGTAWLIVHFNHRPSRKWRKALGLPAMVHETYAVRFRDAMYLHLEEGMSGLPYAFIREQVAAGAEYIRPLKRVKTPQGYAWSGKGWLYG